MHPTGKTSAARERRSWRGFAAAALVLAALFANAGFASAHEAHGHPARIHQGTCDDLGPVAFRLNGVGASVDLDNAPVATPTPVNSNAAYQVMTSDTMIDATLDDLLSSAYAVMVYESDEEMNAIACGPVGGAMAGDTLITGLAEMGVPGHVGFALFRPEGSQLAVQLIVGHAMAPVSASGRTDDRAHQAGEGDDHEHAGDDAGHETEEEDHGAAATPAG